MAIDSSSGMASAGTKLFYSKNDDVALTEVANVKTTPEVGVQPQQLEVTNLGDETQQYDLGMNNSTVLAFSVIYKGPTWNKIYANSGNRVVYNWKLVYPDGMYITFSGPFQVTVQGLDVNTALAYTINISPTVVPKFHKSASDESSGSEESGGDSMGYRPMFVKTFSTVTAMNSYDDTDDSLIQGDFVLVNGTDADRGKVYFYNGSGFTFFANIIGPQGAQGTKGDPGLDMKMLGKKDTLPALANEGEFCFVGTTLYSYSNGNWINLGDFQGPKGDKGDRGDQGLQGEIGQQGNQGIQGIQGSQGVQGKQGDSAYQVAVTNGYSGTQAQWIASLKGATGDKGATGQTGSVGPQGKPGVGLMIAGTLADSTKLPATADDGTGYFIGTHIWVRIKESWVDCGAILPDVTGYTTDSEVANAISTAAKGLIAANSNYGAENLVRNSGYMTSLDHWVPTYTGNKDNASVLIIQHNFYHNGKDNLIAISNSNLYDKTNTTASEVYVTNDYAPVVPGKPATYRVSGFASANVFSSDIYFLGRTVDGTVIPTLLEDGTNLSYSKLDSRSGSFVVPNNVIMGAFRVDHNGSSDGKPSAVYFTEAQIKQESVLSPWTPSPKDKADVSQISPLLVGANHEATDMNNETTSGTGFSISAVKNGPGFSNGDRFIGWRVEKSTVDGVAEVIHQTAYLQTGVTASRTSFSGAGWGPWVSVAGRPRLLTASDDILGLKEGKYVLNGAIPINSPSSSSLAFIPYAWLSVEILNPDDSASARKIEARDTNGNHYINMYAGYPLTWSGWKA